MASELVQKLQTKLYQLKKLMDLDAQNTKAPQSLSIFINSNVDMNEFTHEQLKYCIGLIDDQINDLVQETGYKGCLADL